MAPPLTRPPRAAYRRRRRSAGDLVIGLLAMAALAVLTLGVPFALVTVFGLPTPHAMPSVSLLTRQLTVPAILKVLSVVVWLAWIQLVCCVFAEIRAAVRNAGMPRRVPLAGGTQALVHRLVTSALLLFAATAALSPALAHQAPAAAHSAGARSAGARSAGVRSAAHSAGARSGGARAGAPHGVQQGAGSRGGGAAGSVRQPDGRDAGRPDLAGPPQVAHSPRAGKLYVVKPPVGRFHESLWEIAQKYLGDGRRYREIFELNKDRIQPDGSRLTIASLIRPGWVLHMPRDAHGPGLEAVPAGDGPAMPAWPSSAGAPPQAGEHGHAGAQGSTGEHGHGGARGHAEEHSHPWEPHSDRGPQHAGKPRHEARARHARESPPAGGSRAAAGTSPAAGSRRPAGEGDRTQRPATANGSNAASLLHPGGLTYPDELAAATLLASGILAALGRRRREQLWWRAFGYRVVGPEGQAALAEYALRAGAHEPSARLLDRGLRYLSHAMSLVGRTPPALVAAHLSHDNLDLWVTPADLDAPAPWAAVGDGEVWRLPSTALGRVDNGETGDALFPGLVSLGTDGAGRVLVDVEAAHGVISVTGPRTMTIAVLSAIGLELATSSWSDQMHITLAGFGEDLTVLAPDRITAVPTLEEALPALEAHAIDVAEAMAAAGVSSVLEGRALGVSPHAWVPHYLISAVPPSPRERSRLLTLSRVGRAAAASYIVAGDVPGASWAWEVTPQGQLLAGGLGFEVQAQLAPARQHEALVSLFTAAARPEGVPLTSAPARAAPPEHLDSGSVLPVDIAILGPASVRAPGPIEPDRAALATELVVYLAVHPGGVHPNVLSAALWPRGVAAEVRDAAVARATGWLGADSIGRPHLAADASGRLRLGSGVRVDWQVFRALEGRAELSPPGSAEEAEHLGRALDLVQGQLLEGRPPGRYAWLAADELEYEVTARVADAAHRLAGLRLANGDPEGAIGAARAGLRLARHDEILWRDLLRAAHRTGRQDLLRAVVEELCARTALDEVLPRLAPETESLIDEVYPAWRSTVP